MAARLLAFALAALSVSAQPGGPPKPKSPHRLFASDQPIHIVLKGPISAIARTPVPARTARPATLTVVEPSAEQHPILLSPRGLTRRDKAVCGFPPLRVEFTAKPAPTSLFDGQHRLKLTTYCRTAPAYQQFILLEYAAYRLFNVMTPMSLRARLANVDYAEEDGKVGISRLGFFVEDSDDAAKRNGLVEARMPPRILTSQIDAMSAARSALFEYMIGNLDWSMRAGPAGDVCCHNFRLFAASPTAQSGLIAVPYDFNYSGLVNLPQALPPEGIPINSVRQRYYHDYCVHNPEALRAAAEFRAKRGELMAVLNSIPQLDDSHRRSAAAYLESFLSDIATDADVTNRVLKNCIR